MIRGTRGNLRAKCWWLALLPVALAGVVVGLVGQRLTTSGLPPSPSVAVQMAQVGGTVVVQVGGGHAFGVPALRAPSATVTVRGLSARGARISESAHTNQRGGFLLAVPDGRYEIVASFRSPRTQTARTIVVRGDHALTVNLLAQTG